MSRSVHNQNKGKIAESTKEAQRSMLRSKLSGPKPKPTRDDQLDMASRLFWAICARYPDRIITLIDESGRVVAQGDYVDAPERQYRNE